MRFTLLLLLLLAACRSDPPVSGSDSDDIKVRELRHYRCLRAPSAPTLDGRLDDPCWQVAPWTTDFVDIEGLEKPTPRWRTRARMLWDDEHFYVAAEIEEPHVWATLTRRDSVIFHDNDFEVFIDPDGDTHRYYELEVNAFATEWDLLLIKPYRDGGPAVHAWDIPGLVTAVHVDGTLNDPSDVDQGWTVEIAIPWPALAEATASAVPPRPGDTWWVNFSRVEWRTRVEEGRYVKETDPETGKPLPENNWVWSPQGVIAMHQPETWGWVRFADAVSASEDPAPEPDLRARFLLRRLYEAERAWREEHGHFTADLDVLGLAGPPPGWSWPPRLFVTPSFFEAILDHEDGHLLHISQDGRIWRSEE